jgi:AcrR family transcriptional regulator
MAEESDVRGVVLDAVVDLLESQGYDAVQLRAVAKRAHHRDVSWTNPEAAGRLAICP